MSDNLARKHGRGGKRTRRRRGIRAMRDHQRAERQQVEGFRWEVVATPKGKLMCHSYHLRSGKRSKLIHQITEDEWQTVMIAISHDGEIET